MKLHLPKLLLTAVLATCVAPTAWATISNDSASKTYTVTGGGSGDEDNAIQPPTASDYTLIFKLEANGLDDRNYFSGGDWTAAGAVQIGDVTDGDGNALTTADDSQGMLITNGNGDQDSVFSGTVTGTGAIKRTGAGKVSSITFSGDLTGYKGNIYFGTSEIVTLTFGGQTDAVAAVATTDTMGVAGTGNISISAVADKSKLIFNYSKAENDAYVYITNAISESGNINGSALTLKGGADYYFTKTVRVDTINLEAGSLSLKKESGSGAAYAKQAAIKVSAGAKLIATDNDALGYNDNATTSVTLTGNSTNAATFELRGRQTMTTELHMDGYAKVTASGNGTGDSQPGLNAFRSNGAVIDVTGTNNEIQAALHTRDSFHITVAENGALLVSGQVRAVGDGTKGYTSNPHNYEIGSVVKLGAGSLTFTNAANTFNKTYFNMAGSTVFSHAENATETVSHKLVNGMQIHAGSVLIDAGTEAVLGKRIDVLSGAQLTIKGSIKVEDLSGFDVVMGGGSLSDEVNGYRDAATEGYLIIDGESGSTIEKASATYTIAGKTAEDLVWDGNRLLVSTGNTVAASTVYEVNDTTGGAVVYDRSADKWSQATGIQMRDNTTLQLNTALADTVSVSLTGIGAAAEIQVNGITHDHAKVTTEAGQSVSYNMNGGVLQLSDTQNVNNITSIDMKNGAQVQMHKAANHLGSENAKVQITMSGDSFLSLQNGASGNVWADITVDGTARIGGGIYGSATNVRGTISGEGTLSLVRSHGQYNNEWTVSSVISDAAEGGKLAVVMNCPDGEGGISPVKLSGNNTYTGGTTITKGKLIASHANALGTGKVVVNGGTLRAATGLNIAELEQTSGSLEFATGTTTIKNGLNAVSVDLTDSTKLVLGVAEGTDTTKSFKIGSTVGGAHLQLHEGKVELGNGTHALNHLDVSNGGKSVAHLTLKQGAVVTTNGEMWISDNDGVGVTIEDTASLTVGSVTIKGNGTTSATIQRNEETKDSADAYGVGNFALTISNADVEVTAAADGTTISNRLLSVALTNKGSGTLTATNGYNGFTAINAEDGNINITNFNKEGSQTTVTLSELAIAEGNTVGIYTGNELPAEPTSNNEGTVTTQALTVGKNATLNANLVLANGATVTMAGALTMGSTVTLGTGMELDGALLTSVTGLTAGKTVALFTGVDGLTLGSTSYDANTSLELGTETLGTYFGNVSNPDIYLGYNAATNEVYAGVLQAPVTPAIPEPTTATLSLLALAALAARRRRK